MTSAALQHDQRAAALPLACVRVAVTRAAEDVPALADRLAARGAIPVACPAIRFVGPPAPDELAGAIADEGAGWVVFTSERGVRTALAAARTVPGTPVWQRARVAAVGSATAAALRERGIAVAFVPDRFDGARLAETLPDVAGCGVVLLRAEEGSEALVVGLSARGARVRDVAAYATAPADPAVIRGAFRGGVDAVTFASASAVAGVVAALGTDAHATLTRCELVTIGAVTSEAVRRHGLEVAAEAQTSTLDGLVHALERRLGRREPER